MKPLQPAWTSKAAALAAQPQFVLDLDGAGREKIGRGVGPHDDVAQLLRRDPGSLQGLAGRDHPHSDTIFIRGANPALVDAAALHDPFVVGVHQLFQVLIGQDGFRQIAPGAQDADLMLAQGFSWFFKGINGIYTPAAAKRQLN